MLTTNDERNDGAQVRGTDCFLHGASPVYMLAKIVDYHSPKKNSNLPRNFLDP